MTATPIHDELVDALRRRADVDDGADADADDCGDARADDAAVTTDPAPSLDDAARTALVLAREEAVAGGRARWGTGHVLLGLLRGGDAAADLLHAAGAAADATRRAVSRFEAAAPRGDDDTVTAASDSCSSAAAAVVDAAQATAWVGRRPAVGSADLLAALLDAPAGAAAGVFASLDVPQAELAHAARSLASRSAATEESRRRWRDPSRLVRKRV